MNTIVTILALVTLALFFCGMQALRKCLERRTQPSAQLVLEERAKRWGVEPSLLLEGAAWFTAQKPQKLEMVSADGLTLAARWLPATHARGRILLFHGYRSGGLEDFSVALSVYHEWGYDLLLVDQRAHGASEGKWIGMGVLEKRDCLDWIAETNRLFGADVPVFLSGVSMGATTVLLAAGESMPRNVQGVIADCGFTSPQAILRLQIRAQLHLPAWPLLWITSALCHLLAGYGFFKASTLEALKKSKLPVLFLHGEKDDFVPVEMTLENHSVCVSPKRLVLVPEAVHGAAFPLGGERSRKAILEFLEQYH